MQKTKLTDLWNCFSPGSIRCINLKERKDRKQQSLQVFQHLNIPVTFYEAIRDPKGGEHGCFESHRAVMQECLKDPQCEYALIFEDDVDLLNMPSKSAIDEVVRFLKTTDDWSILFLGGLPNLLNNRIKHVSEYTHIVSAQCQLTHAYIVSRAFMTHFSMISHEAFSVPIDALFAIHRKAYTVYPPWFYQTNSPSDISTAPRYTNHLRKGFVHCKNSYAYYINIPLVFLFLVCLVIVITLLIVCIFHIFKKKVN